MKHCVIKVTFGLRIGGTLLWSSRYISFLELTLGQPQSPDAMSSVVILYILLPCLLILFRDYICGACGLSIFDVYSKSQHQQATVGSLPQITVVDGVWPTYPEDWSSSLFTFKIEFDFIILLFLRPWQTRTHCCRHKCFPVCLRAQLLLRTQILCPQQMFPACAAQET